MIDKILLIITVFAAMWSGYFFGKNKYMPPESRVKQPRPVVIKDKSGGIAEITTSNKLEDDIDDVKRLKRDNTSYYG